MCACSPRWTGCADHVTGSERLLELAQAAHQGHHFLRFAHVSTAYVACARSGPVLEAELSDQHDFPARYERSKYEAERLVRAAAKQPGIRTFASFPRSTITYLIFRPRGSWAIPTPAQ